MNEYYESDLNDPEREVVRPKAKKRHDPFEYCKWAAGDWDARFYAWTKTHRSMCELHIKQLADSPSWYKWKQPKVDKKAASKSKRRKGKTQEWIT